MAVRKGAAVIFFVLLVIVVAQAQDITMLLKNRQIVERQIGCVLGRNACDIIGKQIKGLLPEALNNNCRRCTPDQAQNARKLMAFMKRNHPNDWEQILRLYRAS